ncbi:hypothetical protein ACV35F_34985, partial [Pseudomonas aeruginosa]
RHPQRRWFEDDLAALGYDPSTVRRAFKREFGVTFLEMARLRRLGQVAERLSSGARRRYGSRCRSRRWHPVARRSPARPRKA